MLSVSEINVLCCCVLCQLMCHVAVSVSAIQTCIVVVVVVYFNLVVVEPNSIYV